MWNYRGISVLSVARKVFADIIFQRLQLPAELLYPQSQSGCRNRKSTIDRIFIIQQLMKKTSKQCINLYIVFADFIKAFDTINRELLFIILGKLGCPQRFKRIIRKLYSDVHARLIVDGDLTQAFEYNCGIKQGCKLQSWTKVLRQFTKTNALELTILCIWMKTSFSSAVTPSPLKQCCKTLYGCLFVSNIEKGEGGGFLSRRQRAEFTLRKNFGNFHVSTSFVNHCLNLILLRKIGILCIFISYRRCAMGPVYSASTLFREKARHVH